MTDNDKQGTVFYDAVLRMHQPNEKIHTLSYFWKKKKTCTPYSFLSNLVPPLNNEHSLRWKVCPWAWGNMHK